MTPLERDVKKLLRLVQPVVADVEDKFISQAEAAKYLERSEDSVRRLRYEGFFPSTVFNKKGRQPRYLLSELKQFKYQS